MTVKSAHFDQHYAPTNLNQTVKFCTSKSDLSKHFLIIILNMVRFRYLEAALLELWTVCWSVFKPIFCLKKQLKNEKKPELYHHCFFSEPVINSVYISILNSTALVVTLDLLGGTFTHAAMSVESTSRQSIHMADDFPLIMLLSDSDLSKNNNSILVQAFAGGEESCGSFPTLSSDLIQVQYYTGSVPFHTGVLSRHPHPVSSINNRLYYDFSTSLAKFEKQSILIN